jgi:hypothetical protein
MGTYVLGYQPKPEQELDPAKPGVYDRVNPRDIEVQFSDKPEWTFGALEFAEAQFGLLNSIRVHVGQHYCKFEVENLGEDRFTIVCKSHPGLTGA